MEVAAGPQCLTGAIGPGLGPHLAAVEGEEEEEGLEASMLVGNKGETGALPLLLPLGLGEEGRGGALCPGPPCLEPTWR